MFCAWDSASTAKSRSPGQIYEKQGNKDRAMADLRALAQRPTPCPGNRDRLAALKRRSGPKVDAAVAKYKDDLQHQRTIDLGKPKGNKAMPNSSYCKRWRWISGAGNAVKFVSGDENLKKFTDALRTGRTTPHVPDDTPVRFCAAGALLFDDDRQVHVCADAAGRCREQ